MPAIEPSSPPPATAADFEARLLSFINETLPRLDRRGRTWEPVSSSTLLFATGLLDSLSILHLIAAVEELTGRAVPDQLVVMKYFQSVEAIIAAFWTPNSNHQP
jgi:acyl carrier protein